MRQSRIFKIVCRPQTCPSRTQNSSTHAVHDKIGLVLRSAAEARVSHPLIFKTSTRPELSYRSRSSKFSFAEAVPTRTTATGPLLVVSPLHSCSSVVVKCLRTHSVKSSTSNSWYVIRSIHRANASAGVRNSAYLPYLTVDSGDVWVISADLTCRKRWLLLEKSPDETHHPIPSKWFFVL